MIMSWRFGGFMHKIGITYSIAMKLLAIYYVCASCLICWDEGLDQVCKLKLKSYSIVAVKKINSTEIGGGGSGGVAN